MSTNYISPLWRMPRNANNIANRYSNYSVQSRLSTGINCGPMGDIIGSTDLTFNIWIKPEFDYNTGFYQTFFGNLAGNTGILLYYHQGDDVWRGAFGNGVGLEIIESALVTSNEELGKGEWQMHTLIIKQILLY